MQEVVDSLDKQLEEAIEEHNINLELELSLSKEEVKALVSKLDGGIDEFMSAYEEITNQNEAMFLNITSISEVLANAVLDVKVKLEQSLAQEPLSLTTEPPAPIDKHVTPENQHEAINLELDDIINELENANSAPSQGQISADEFTPLSNETENVSDKDTQQATESERVVKEQSSALEAGAINQSEIDAYNEYLSMPDSYSGEPDYDFQTEGMNEYTYEAEGVTPKLGESVTNEIVEEVSVDTESLNSAMDLPSLKSKVSDITPELGDDEKYQVDNTNDGLENALASTVDESPSEQVLLEEIDEDLNGVYESDVSIEPQANNPHLDDIDEEAGPDINENVSDFMEETGQNVDHVQEQITPQVQPHSNLQSSQLEQQSLSNGPGLWSSMLGGLGALKSSFTASSDMGATEFSQRYLQKEIKSFENQCMKNIKRIDDVATLTSDDSLLDKAKIFAATTLLGRELEGIESNATRLKKSTAGHPELRKQFEDVVTLHKDMMNGSKTKLESNLEKTEDLAIHGALKNLIKKITDMVQNIIQKILPAPDSTAQNKAVKAM